MKAAHKITVILTFMLLCITSTLLSQSSDKNNKAKRYSQNPQPELTVSTDNKPKKHLPRLVWCGWRYGFHWSNAGNRRRQ